MKRIVRRGQIWRCSRIGKPDTYRLYKIKQVIGNQVWAEVLQSPNEESVGKIREVRLLNRPASCDLWSLESWASEDSQEAA